MGYYTRYHLTIVRGEETYGPSLHEQVELELEEIAGWNHMFDEACKWYEWEDNMKTLSRKFPQAVFQLNGEGEEQGDIWIAFFENGKKVFRKAEIKLDTSCPF